MTKIKLSQTMEEALVYLSRGAYRAHLEPERRTLAALERRGMIEWAEAVEVGTTYDNTILWNVTIAGWAWLKAECGVDRPADEGRLTLAEAENEAWRVSESTGTVTRVYATSARVELDNGDVIWWETGTGHDLTVGDQVKVRGEYEPNYRVTQADSTEDDPTLYTGTVTTVVQTGVAADFPGFPRPDGSGPGTLMMVDTGYGHGLNVGQMIQVDARGFYAGAVSSVLGPVIDLANKITHDRDEARAREAERFSGPSHPVTAAPYAESTGRVNGQRVQDAGSTDTYEGVSGPGSGPDLYIDREAWKARSRVLDDIARSLSMAANARRTHDRETVLSDDGTPMVFRGVRIPEDLADTYSSLAAISWCRGVAAAQRAARKEQGK